MNAAYEYGVWHVSDPSEPHRSCMTEEDARKWVAELEEDDYPAGGFVVVRREVGPWEVVS